MAPKAAEHRLRTSSGRLLVLFGRPGTGKTTAGQILEDTFGFVHYDTKIDFTDEQKHAIAEDRPMTEDMRVEFFQRVHHRVDELLKSGRPVAVDNAFINDRFRCEFLERFPQAVFVLVTADLALETTRMMRGRPAHPISPANSLAMSREFEAPTIPHHVLDNGSDDRDALRANLERLLQNLGFSS